MAREISNHDDVIDSRDVIERIEELAAGENERWFTEADTNELAALRRLADEGADLADWEHGETLIRDSYFVEYAQDLAEDIGAIDQDAAWPYTSIDWEHAAWELRMDYTPIEFDGVTYWGRS